MILAMLRLRPCEKRREINLSRLPFRHLTQAPQIRLFKETSDSSEFFHLDAYF